MIGYEVNGDKDNLGFVTFDISSYIGKINEKVNIPLQKPYTKESSISFIITIGETYIRNKSFHINASQKTIDEKLNNLTLEDNDSNEDELNFS